jgi:hypothetical protein
MVITSEWVGDITIGTVTYDCGMVGLHQLQVDIVDDHIQRGSIA